MYSKREYFPAHVTEIHSLPEGCVQLFFRDENYPVDFGPQGRLTGAGPRVFLGPTVQGYGRDKPLERYRNFGKNGLVVGTKVWVYHRPGSYDDITYVKARDDGKM